MKKPWLAGLLSFIFAGVGHLYLGKVKKGLIILVLYFASLLLTGVYVGIFTLPIVWIHSIISSVIDAKKLNQSEMQINVA